MQSQYIPLPTVCSLTRTTRTVGIVICMIFLNPQSSCSLYLSRRFIETLLSKSESKNLWMIFIDLVHEPVAWGRSWSTDSILGCYSQSHCSWANSNCLIGCWRQQRGKSTYYFRQKGPASISWCSIWGFKGNCTPLLEKQCIFDVLIL